MAKYDEIKKNFILCSMIKNDKDNSVTIGRSIEDIVEILGESILSNCDLSKRVNLLFNKRTDEITDIINKLMSSKYLDYTEDGENIYPTSDGINYFNNIAYESLPIDLQIIAQENSQILYSK